MIPFRSLVNVAFSASVFWLLPSVFCSGQSETPVWQSLPDATVAATRIPNGREALEALKESKFGQVMLSEKRKAAIIAVCEEHGDEQWVQVRNALKQYDVTFEEIAQLFAGETGYAVTLGEDADEQPVVLGLGWMQPGDELVAKLFDIVGKVIDEQDSEQADARMVTRFDVEVAGQKAMQLRIPSVSIEYTEDFELPDDYDDLPEDEQEAAYNEAEEAYEAGAVEEIAYRTVVLTQAGDWLLIAHQFQALPADAVDATEQQVSELLADVLANQRSGGADGFAPRLMDVPGVAETMTADGLPVFELLMDLPSIRDALRKFADSDKFDQGVRLFGLAEIGPAALRQTADGPQWLTQFGLSLPAPRSGLMKLLDQEMVAVDPPQWVPESVVRYFQLSFDLQAAYQTIKEEVTSEFPDQTEPGFNMAETQVKNFTQSELPELLGALGTRHTIMSLGVYSIDLSSEEDDKADVVERMAVVWQLADQDVWSRLMKAVAPFTGMAPGVEAAQEQGFSGYRMKKGDNEGGVMLGNGYLVVGVGNGVLETVLAALNNPPSGSNALRGSEVFERATELADLSPAMIAEITDNDRYIQMVFRNINDQLDQFESLAGALREQDGEQGIFFFDLVRAILPSNDELPGMMGVSTARLEVNDDGVFSQSMQEMPLK